MAALFCIAQSKSGRTNIDAAAAVMMYAEYAYIYLSWGGVPLIASSGVPHAGIIPGT